jgi:hypothetical protein
MTIMPLHMPAMRRVPGAGLLASVLLALLLVTASATVAAADGPAQDGGVLLAVDGELLGPEPMPRDAEDNPARELAGYGDRETQFTWGAAWLLTFLGLAGLAVMGLVYFRAVERPGADDKASARR